MVTHELEGNVKLRPVSIDGNFGDTLPMGSVRKTLINYNILKILRYT